jgi:hypothetical protein
VKLNEKAADSRNRIDPRFRNRKQKERRACFGVIYKTEDSLSIKKIPSMITDSNQVCFVKMIGQ